MAKQMGTFVDDARLLPRDNSGGPMGPQKSGQWGEGGKTVAGGGEPAGPHERNGMEDEMKMPARGNKRSGGY